MINRKNEKYLNKSLESKDPKDSAWDDWAATALYFTTAVNPKSPVRYGTLLQMENLLFNMMIESLPRSYGGNWMDEKGNITARRRRLETGLKLYKTLDDAGVTRKDSLSDEYPAIGRRAERCILVTMKSVFLVRKALESPPRLQGSPGDSRW